MFIYALEVETLKESCAFCSFENLLHRIFVYKQQKLLCWCLTFSVVADSVGVFLDNVIDTTVLSVHPCV